MEKFLSSVEKLTSSVPESGPHEEQKRGTEEKDSTAGKGEHKLYELIRQLQVGERSPDDLFMWEYRRLKQLEDLEAELLEGMSEEERMRLGFIPEKKELGFIDKLMQLMN